MPRVCSVCSRQDRGAIDQRLAFQVVNVAELARSLGLGVDALHRHRARHIPTFLPAFQASADALTLGALAGEAHRLYALTLDALARAEAGVVGETASHAEVARFIKEARNGLGLLVKLSADAGSTDERPTGVANGELDARIAAALGQVMARGRGQEGQSAIGASDGTHTPDLIEGDEPGLVDADGAGQVGHPGGHVGQRPTPSSPPNSPDLATHQTEIEARLERLNELRAAEEKPPLTALPAFDEPETRLKRRGGGPGREPDAPRRHGQFTKAD